jgi:poly-gamma-glutamate synthesis protein (capsule biosynthesis protein)
MKYLFFATVVIFLSVVFFFVFRSYSLRQKTVVKGPAELLHSSHAYDSKFFDEAYEKSKPYVKKSDEFVYGGIIPHHLYAAPLIAAFFEGISQQKVDTVILLSPNHYGIGIDDIATEKEDWSTIYGTLKTDKEKIDYLVNQRAAKINETIFDNEHGIYGITSFIKKTFPSAKIIPIVFRANTKKEELDKLVSSLQPLMNEHTMIIASVDFSHYLPSDQADLHDAESREAISGFDTDKIFSFDPVKNFDSPSSIYTVVSLMKKIGVTDLNILQNTNSAKLANDLSIQSTTSYFTMYFTKNINKTKVEIPPTSTNVDLSGIFSYKDPSQLNSSGDGEYELLVTGDVGLVRTVNSKILNSGDPGLPFKNVKDFLKKGDVVFINLEGPLVEGCEPTVDGMIFCGDPKNVEGLVASNVKVASVANNHAGNYGVEGLTNTVNVLKAHGISPVGAGEPAIVKVKDKTFGFLGYNDVGAPEQGMSWAYGDTIKKEVALLKKQVDFVVVMYHWGVEYTSVPTQEQIDLAHLTVDAGADLVLGNHPHWVQGTETYKNKFIVYGFGNFIFDQMWSQETREGVVGKFLFNSSGLKSVSFYPIIIEDYWQPRFANKEEAAKILNGLKESSEEIKKLN